MSLRYTCHYTTRVYSMLTSRLFTLCLALFLGISGAWAAPASLRTSTGSEIFLRTFPGEGNTLMLGFPCDEGLGTEEARASQSLARLGLEAWLPDMLGAHSLPALASSMDQLPPLEIAEVIGQTIKLSGKKVVLVTTGRGALPILQGAYMWQNQATPQERAALTGIILFSPELYSVKPAPGVEARYHSIVSRTSLPVFIYQGQRSPARWWLEHLKVEFSLGGSKISSKVLPNVRGFFYSVQDPTEEEKAMTDRLPELILDAIKQLEAAR
ncbi:hypothetical protein SCD_n01142 [Sulfuricella denitrificans skB26]|uniref:Alpha/beta hydrolase n=2 Tax=Sulfuricella denitrificans TaxID=649841 RepID=S6AG69_SULDS|nr:hypothetical protein SCD_n01142 [Sulfuricella denitrificans skB26]